MLLHLLVILSTGGGGGLPRYSQQAGDTHPTGMHTCLLNSILYNVPQDTSLLHVDEVQRRGIGKIASGILLVHKAIP